MVFYLGHGSGTSNAFSSSTTSEKISLSVQVFFITFKKKIRISVTSTQTTTIGLAIKNTYKAYTSDASDIDANIKIIYRKNFGGDVSYHPNYFRHPGIGGVYHGYFKQDFYF
jgi:hypothetical protein